MWLNLSGLTLACSASQLPFRFAVKLHEKVHPHAEFVMKLVTSHVLFAHDRQVLTCSVHSDQSESPSNL